MVADEEKSSKGGKTPRSMVNLTVAVPEEESQKGRRKSRTSGDVKPQEVTNKNALHNTEEILDTKSKPKATSPTVKSSGKPRAAKPDTGSDHGGKSAVSARENQSRGKKEESSEDKEEKPRKKRTKNSILDPLQEDVSETKSTKKKK